MKKFFAVGVLLLLSACGIAPAGQNVPLLEGPPVTKIESPNKALLACLSEHLTPEQHATSWAVGDLADRTGRFNFSSNDGTGMFSTQGASDALTNALREAGVNVVDVSPTMRGLFDWYILKHNANLVGDGKVREMTKPGGGSVDIRYLPMVQGTVMQPQFVIVGSINSLDTLPGGGAEAAIDGIGAGYRQYRVFFNTDAHVTKMPFGTDLGGEVVATDSLTRQVVSDEVKADIAHFFGDKFVSFNMGSQRRGALQYIELRMMEPLAYDLVSKTFGIHACDKETPVIHEKAPEGKPNS